MDQELEEQKDKTADKDLQALRPGTMDIDKLNAALEAMREGLSEKDLEEIIAAMNEEYLETDDDNTL